MKNISDALSKYFATVPDFVRKKRVLVWLLLLGITVIAILGFSKVKFDQTTDGWFEDDDPVKIALDDFKAEFGSDDGLFIVYKPKDGNLFSKQSLEAVLGVSNDIINARAQVKDQKDSPFNHVVNVTSLINASYLEVEDDMLTSKELVGTSVPDSKKELEKIKDDAQINKTFRLVYYSDDLTYGGILIETDFGATPVDFEEVSGDELELDSDADNEIIMDETITDKKVRFKPTDTKDYIALMNAINKILENKKYSESLEFHPIGNAAQSVYDAKNLEQMGMLYLGMLIIMIVILWFIFRSFSGVLWPLLIVIIGTIWTIGFSGWFGLTLTFYVMLTVMMLLAIGMADTIHVLSEYLFFRNEGDDHRKAMKKSYKQVAIACILTSFTTMIGFVALATSQIVHIRIFGYMTTIGILIELLLTLYILPLMIDLWSPVRKKEKVKKKKTSIGKFIPNFSLILQKRIDGIVPFVEKRPISILVFFLLILGFCVVGASMVKVSFNMMDNYEETSPLRKSYELVDNHMMGTQNMEVFLDLGEENAFQDPKVLHMVDELEQKIKKYYAAYVLRTSSIVDVVKDANKKLNGGKESMYSIPPSRQIVSQTLFMFNNADPAQRRKVVSDDYSKSHITVNLKNSDAASYEKVFQGMQNDIDKTVSELKEKYPKTKLTLTGTLSMMMRASTFVSQSTGGSLIFAVLAISLTLLVVFGSFKVGLLAIIPNIIPSILVYSILGWFDIPLDMNTLLIGPIIIGIAVDDTIHFISHYKTEVVRHGNIRKALVDSIKEAGQAVVFSTLVLGLGFGILSFASGPVSNTGKLGALAIFAGLFCELLLLPALILIFKPTFGRKREIELKEVE